MASGYRPSLVAGRIFRRLADDTDMVGRGIAFADGIGFALAETEMADKRADYFEAGTVVARTVRRFRADGYVAEFGTGTEADAEPAVPGWRLAVDGLMA